MTSPFTPPERKALSDAELAGRLEQMQAVGGAIEALEFLQNQNQLRAADEIAFVAWIRAMEADGSAQALSALAAARAKASGLSIETSILEPELKSTLEGDLAALGDWQGRAAEAEAKRLELERIEAERLAVETAEAERLKAESIEAQRVAAEITEAERLEAERIAFAAAEAERIELEELAAQVAQLERIEAERLYAEASARAEAEAAAKHEEALQVAEELSQEVIEPQRASDYATGSFDIIETAQVTIVDEVDPATFESLLEQDEIAFTDEGKKQKQPIAEVARRSKALSQLFVWTGITVGIIPILLGAFVAQTGLPILLVLGALVIGFVFSAVIIASGAVAGKRSGLQTLMLSRASLGVRGGSAVAIPVFVSKIFVGTVTVVAIGKQLFDGTVVGLPTLGSNVTVGSTSISWLAVLAIALIFVAAVFATLGGRVLYWLQWGAAVVGVLAVATFFIGVAPAFGNSKFDFTAAISGPQVAQALTLAGLLGAGLGAIWTASVADFTRHVPMSESGKKVALFVALPVGVLSLLAAVAGAFAFAAAKGAGTQSVMTSLLSVLPEWAGSAVLVGGGLQLLVWSASWLYSSSVSLRGLGVRVGRVLSQSIVFVLVIACLAIGAAASAEALRATFVIALIVLMAFAGAFVGDVWRRKAAYDETGLRQAFGVYGAVNWVNLSSFIAAVILGLGFVSTSLDQYFVTNFIGRYLTAIDFTDALAGFFIAFVIAALVPVAFGGKRIRAQEQKVYEVEARRNTFDSINLGSI